MAADPITKTTVDDLLSYDFSDDGDPFNNKPAKKRDDKAVLSPRAPKRPFDNDDKENFGGLGIEEEVKITKKRRPNPKLDEERLLSAPGIPKLRALSRSGKIAKKLHFKGKGHEFSDVARLLNYYQLWLDDLFPRAKFADGLKMIEKVGHSKRMAVNRKTWIDEGKPEYARDKALRKEQDEYEKATEKAEQPKADEGDKEESSDLFFAHRSGQKDETNDQEPEEDELDALLAEQATRISPKKPSKDVADSEGKDDLDALLAEQETRRTGGPAAQGVRREDEDEEDDLDALLAEQDTRNAAQLSVAERPRKAVFDEDDDDDLDALLAEQDNRNERTLAPVAEQAATDAGDGAAPAKVTGTEAPGAKDMVDILSSPLPNNPEEEDLADFLSSPIPNED